MLAAAIRVLARSAALQAEEVAARHAVYRSAKGKEREVDRFPGHPGRVDSQEPGNAEEEKSEELKEAEEKIKRLLSRVKKHQGPSGLSGPSAPSTTVKVEALPAETRAPKTVMDSTPGHYQTTASSSDREVDLPPPSKEESRLAPDTREPKTILPSVTASSSLKHASSHGRPGASHTIAKVDPDISSPLAASTSAVSSSSTVQTIIDTPPAVVADDTSAQTAPSDPSATTLTREEDEETPIMLRASKVPSSRIGRLFHYGSLAASLSLGAATESIRRTTGGGGQGSVFMSDSNVRRLVATLGRMRGAALKLGQFMSIQDNHMLPPEIEKVLQQVQAHANYMPDWQMERVMREELGTVWPTLFTSFDRTPFASASIGQVHKATLATTGLPVAVKIQFPGVADSIASDLGNLSILIRSSALLPPGLYLQNTIAVMKRELEDECDYIREAASGRRFRDHLKDDPFFVVPRVVDEATTGKVLTTEWMSGKPLSRMKGMSQATRDKIGTNILRLCLQELFHFRFMQTDPNWANFLYDSTADTIQLIDFGASREYTKEFMDGWYRLLRAALEGDRGVMKAESENLGYLTGEENEEMLRAHLDSMALIASPFSHDGPYPFENQTITDSVRALIPIMLKHRLTPPPPETYSLNRKLSGAFLMCARLGAHVDCKKLWEENVAGYKEG